MGFRAAFAKIKILKYLKLFIMPEATQLLNPKEVLSRLNLTEGMQIADLGCGNLGYFIIPAAQLVGKKGKAYAVDVLEPVLDAVRNKAKLLGLVNLETVRSNLEMVGSTKIPEGSLDAASLINVMFQNKKYKEMLQEASRLLKSQGKLLVIDWKKIAIPFGPSIDLRIDPAQIKMLASQLGLNLVEEAEFGQYFWGLIFEKV
jgi:ubiquinone/menaquinone biosynthesis C-methylase UbiE